MTPSEREPAAVAEAAAALLALAMEQSQAPVGELGSALERIARALDSCNRLAEQRRTGTANAGALADMSEQLQREVAVCIESLQFHDRLMQQLTHAHACLTALRSTASPQTANDLLDTWLRRHASEGSVELF